MAGSYHLTIFIYYLGLWSRHPKSYPLSVKDLGEKLTSNKFLIKELQCAHIYIYIFLTAEI